MRKGYTIIQRERERERERERDLCDDEDDRETFHDSVLGQFLDLHGDFRKERGMERGGEREGEREKGEKEGVACSMSPSTASTKRTTPSANLQSGKMRNPQTRSRNEMIGGMKKERRRSESGREGGERDSDEGERGGPESCCDFICEVDVARSIHHIQHIRLREESEKRREECVRVFSQISGCSSVHRATNSLFVSLISSHNMSSSPQ
jgi:hypothetical protein